MSPQERGLTDIFSIDLVALFFFFFKVVTSHRLFSSEIEHGPSFNLFEVSHMVSFICQLVGL